MGFPCAALKDSQEHKRGAPAWTQEWSRRPKLRVSSLPNPSSSSQRQDPRN